MNSIILLLALTLAAGACSKEGGKPDSGGSPPQKTTVLPAGEALFRERCRDCHKMHGEGGVMGPDLSDVGTRRSRAYLEQVIREPSKIYPGTAMPPGDSLSVGQVKLLVDYLKTD